MNTTVKQVETWACRVPLAKPLRFGTFTATERHYTVVRLTCADGTTGTCVGHSRGSPIDMAISDLLGRVLIGTDGAAPEHRLADLLRAVVAIEADGMIGRAISLLELCCWDIAAKSAGQPLFRYLGAEPAPLRVCLVEGYPMSSDGSEGLVRRLLERTQEGFEMLKLEGSHFPDAAALVAAARSVGDMAPDDLELVADMAWSWTDGTRCSSYLDAISATDFAWIEDPLPRDQRRAIGSLHDRLRCPLAIGDETTRASDLLNLIDDRAIDVARIDPTTIGGLARARELCAAATAAGIRVSFHIHPEINRHLALWAEGCDHVEIFPADRAFDAAYQLIRDPAARDIRDGTLTASEVPGIGLELREDQVDRYATRKGVLKSDDT